MVILAYILSGLSLLMSILLLVKLKVLNLALFAKLFAGALSPIWACAGMAGAILSWIHHDLYSIPIGVIGSAMMVAYILRITRDHDGFDNAFGEGWSDPIPTDQIKRMVRKRWSVYLKLKANPRPSWERNVSFWRIPGSERELLCDIWRPSEGYVSGLAYIYLHGSGFFIGDKDFGTRPYFNHLVAQGHTVMDVAYRLCPEVDIYGMIGDVKHAVAWMKKNATRYGVNPAKIILGGGSAGCHLAMLAAYTPTLEDFTPGDLEDEDLSVRGVISLYGPSDLYAGYEPWKKSNPNRDLPGLTIGQDLDSKLRMRYAGRLDILLGGTPEERPEIYQLASPIHHVHPGCPPTLLIQGDKDLLVSVETTNSLYNKLVNAGVPAINRILPWTDHIFDIVLPQISPPAHSAYYDIDRFLGLMLNQETEYVNP
jgi:acetyl esterase/lipase